MAELPAAPAFGIFERDLLPERIAERLVSLIAERQLRPGDRLPSERDLAATMRVSRATLREALRALAMLNIIEIRPGSGTYVTSLKPELLVEHLDFIFALDDSTFAELLEARAELEPRIAALAASHATAEELAAIQAGVVRARECVDDAARFLEADVALHQLITEAAHNQILTRFMASLTRLGMASRRRTGELASVRHKTVIEHEAVAEALLRRDPQAAAAAMQRHIDHIRQSLRAIGAQDTPTASS
jgi:GntR family transcriptional repressor for pyruvate dehydrogenase complex